MEPPFYSAKPILKPVALPYLETILLVLEVPSYSHQSQLWQRCNRSVLQARIDYCPIRQADQYLKRLEHLGRFVGFCHNF